MRRTSGASLDHVAWTSRRVPVSETRAAAKVAVAPAFIAFTCGVITRTGEVLRSLGRVASWHDIKAAIATARIQHAPRAFRERAAQNAEVSAWYAAAIVVLKKEVS